MEDLEDDNSAYWQTVGQWEQWQEENADPPEPAATDRVPIEEPPF
jgi:hypothetical protein